jgi:uncharacterized protein YeaO (DUF488 family)
MARRDAPRNRPNKAAQPVTATAAGHRVGVTRAYEAHAHHDGTRVLVDRLWPRGLSKQQVAVDLWLKDVAPSDALRRWYGHQPRRWPAFALRYRAELARHDDLLRLLDELRRRGPVVLLYGARDTERNNAVVLRDVLEERAAAPTSTSKGKAK